MLAKAWRKRPRTKFISLARGRKFVFGIECRRCTPAWLRAIRATLRRVRRSRRDWHRLRARVIGFEVVDMGRLTAAEFKNGYSDHYSEACFIAPGIIRLSTRCQPSAPLVAHECGHAITTRAEWNTREREIDGLRASEGCANRYVMKWGFGEAALRRIVHSQIGHMGGVPGETIHLGKRTYRITRDFRYRALGVQRDPSRLRSN